MNPFRLIASVICGVCLLGLQAYAQLPQEGHASYYGQKFHGRTTANGERFSMWQLTAAHRTLPFDTKIKVTNLANGKSVELRVNDRGPFVAGRILDVSRGAAAKLGMIESGTARVRIESAVADQKLELEEGEYYAINVNRTPLRGFGIQVASYKGFDNLVRRLDELLDKNLGKLHVQVASIDGDRFYRVILGGFPTREAAEKKLATLKKDIKDSFVLELM